MKIKNVVLPLLLFITLILFACSSSANLEKGYVEGEIVVVNNEPFTKLAVKVATNEYYILDCRSDIEKELWCNQGARYKIYFSEHNKALVVNKIVKIIN